MNNRTGISDNRKQNYYCGGEFKTRKGMVGEQSVRNLAVGKKTSFGKKFCPEVEG